MLLVSVSPEPVEGRLTSIGSVLGELTQQIPVLINQRLFLDPRPAVDRPFRSEILWDDSVTGRYHQSSLEMV